MGDIVGYLFVLELLAMELPINNDVNGQSLDDHRNELARRMTRKSNAGHNTRIPATARKGVRGAVSLSFSSSDVPQNDVASVEWPMIYSTQT